VLQAALARTRVLPSYAPDDVDVVHALSYLRVQQRHICCVCCGRLQGRRTMLLCRLL
jgi:hypothetical protein